MNNPDKLIKGALHLIPIYLLKFNLVDNQDAESDCYEALYKASLSFDESKGILFTTYAATCIYNALAYFERARKQQSYIQIVSLYDTVTSDIDYKRTIEDLIILRNSPDDILKQREHYNMIWATIQKAVEHFSDNDISKKVIVLWLNSDCTLKQTELANLVGITQSRVSCILGNFKRILRLEIEKLEE